MPSELHHILRNRHSEKDVLPDEPHYLIVLDGPFPSEPIEPTDPENPPQELVGSYLIG